MITLQLADAPTMTFAVNPDHISTVFDIPASIDEGDTKVITHIFLLNSDQPIKVRQTVAQVLRAIEDHQEDKQFRLIRTLENIVGELERRT